MSSNIGLALSALLLIFGCSQPSLQNVKGTVTVTGTVSFDGSPLSNGRISFIDSEGDPPREYIAAIHDGQFEIQAPPGIRRVEIRAIQDLTSAEADAVEEFVQPIPARYNESSELTVELTHDGPDVLTFDLQSTPKDQ